MVDLSKSDIRRAYKESIELFRCLAVADECHGGRNHGPISDLFYDYAKSTITALYKISETLGFEIVWDCNDEAILRNDTELGGEVAEYAAEHGLSNSQIALEAILTEWAEKRFAAKQGRAA